MKKILFGSFALMGATLQAAEVAPDVEAQFNQDGQSRVIITFHDKTSRSRLRVKGSKEEVSRTLKANYVASSRGVKSMLSSGLRSNASVEGEYWAANAMLAEVDNTMLEQIASNPDVSQITMDRVIPFEELPENPEEQIQEDKWTYGLKKLGVDKVREAYNLTGEGVTVGVLDTGIDAEHPDLAGKVVAWADYAGDSEDPKDAHGHGTHCAGTIAGGNAGGKHIGVAPDAKLIIGRIFGDSGGATLSGILGAMNWMTDPDGDANTNDFPDLISNSWGGRKGSMQKEQAMWNLVQSWRDLGIVPVFAAGNSGPWPKTVGTPGGYPHSYAVAATDSSDSAASFSSRGPIVWEGETYIKPDIAAPGVNVFSAEPGGGYQKMSGTSMACPHVAGLTALLLQANPALTVSQVEELLNTTSVDLGDEGKDNTFGHGRADIMAAVEAAKGIKESQRQNFKSIFGAE